MVNKRVSIKNLSEITGYSVATISRVINNKGKYSKETEKRVREAIAKFDYQPNMIAKGLRTNHLPTIGIIVPDITNEYFSTITLAAQKELFKNDFSAFICNTNENRELEEKHMQLLRSQNVSGVIFVCCEQSFDRTGNENIAMVYVDRMPKVEEDEGTRYLVQSDNYEGARLAIRELVNSGCKRIVCIMDIRDISPKINRLRGVVDELKVHGLEERIYYAKEISYDGVYSIMKKILDDGLNFDGVFSYNDIGALSVIKALSNKGINVPKAVKVMGYDGISHAEYNTPSISTIHQPMEKMGKLAVQMMLKVLKREEIDEKVVVLPVELAKRYSTTNIGL